MFCKLYAKQVPTLTMKLYQEGMGMQTAPTTRAHVEAVIFPELFFSAFRDTS